MKDSLIHRIVRRQSRRPRCVVPAEGYNQWAATYDSQPDNAVLVLESRLFSELLGRVSIEGKHVADIGCGTGRHWQEILSRHPARLIGADPSSGMLGRLKARHPDSQVICTEGDRLEEIADQSCDLIVSTLTLAHVSDAARALGEWRRVLCSGGAMLITDFHPDAFFAGMKRTFVNQGETIEIEHHATEIHRLHAIAADCGLVVAFASEASIDDSVRSLFERNLALKRYEEYKGLRLVFGVHLTKP